MAKKRTTTAKKEAATEAYKVRAEVQTRTDRVPFGQLKVNPKTWGYRAPGDYDLDKKVNQQLQEDIRNTGGILEPLLVVEVDGSDALHVRHGFRRHITFKGLVELKDAPDFTNESLVPVTIAPADTADDELIARGVSSNTHREALPPTGRARATHELRAAGWAVEQIAALFAVDAKTVKRDLALQNDEWALGHIEAHNCRFSTMAKLYAKAAGKERLDEFKDAFDKHIAKLKEEIEEDERKAVGQGKEPFKPERKWPQKRLKSKVTDTWLLALDHGKTLKTRARLRFSAGVDYKEDGAIDVKVSALSTNYAQLELDELADVIEMTTNFTEELDELFVRKQKEDRMARGRSSTAGAERLARLGYKPPADEDDDPGDIDDDDFEETAEANIVPIGEPEEKPEAKEEADAVGDDE